MIFQGYGVEVGIKNQSKIHQKLKPKMDCLLASIFAWFWWVLGGKLGAKIEPRTINDRFKKASNKLWKKTCKKAEMSVLGGVIPRARKAAGGPRDRLIDQNQRNQPTENWLTIQHALRAEARLRLCM